MRLVAAALTAALLVAAPAFAQRGATVPADDIEAAKAHYAAGSAYYEQANYADAVKEFNEAYRLSKRTDLLYNIAICYERIDDFDNAIATLQKYLTERPDAKDRVTIESRIANLTKLRDQKRAALPVQPQPTQPQPQPGQVQPVQAVPVAPQATERAPKWWLAGTVVTVVGAGVLIAALGTGLVSAADYNDLKTKCMNNVCDPSLKSERDSGKNLAVASDVLLGIGAAAVVAGVIAIGVMSRPVKKKEAPRAQLYPTPTGLYLKF
jgi:tetratricopeptide (TPR) repeat protein